MGRNAEALEELIATLDPQPDAAQLEAGRTMAQALDDSPRASMMQTYLGWLAEIGANAPVEPDALDRY